MNETRANSGGRFLLTKNRGLMIGRAADAALTGPGGLFECIRAEMAKGSPEGYNAETGSEQPAQKLQTGEP
ncbi:MAG: hypothetical protein ABSB88_06785, partial [Bryobacteraceae bacterium]